MRSPLFENPPLGRLSSSHKLALGSDVGVTGASIIILSMLLGWTELSRPWSFLIGLAGGMTSGGGAALAVCGLVGMTRGESRTRSGC